MPQMAKLTDLGITLAAAVAVRFVGKPEPTSFVSTSGGKDEPYYVWRLNKPVTVLCSLDSDVLPQEVDELYVRQSLLEHEGWEKDNDGYFIPGFVTDFSLNQKICIYQAETIRAFVKDNRAARKGERNSALNSGIVAKMEERRKAAGGK